MAVEESHAEGRTTGSTTHCVGLRRVAEGEFAPTDFAVAPGDADRKFVVDQPGFVHVLEAPHPHLRDVAGDPAFGPDRSLTFADPDLRASMGGGEEFPDRGVPGESDRLPRWER